MIDSNTYDVIIVGTGAGGGTLAQQLAASGRRILLLERGGWLPGEPQDADVFVGSRYVSPDTWYDSAGATFQPQVYYFVGGATKLYGGALYRLRERDFGEMRHYDGSSPAWPVSYTDLEPFYTAAERLYQVHGARGEDPTEPLASAAYPFPAISHEPRIQRLADDLTAAGYHPFHAPCAIMADARPFTKADADLVAARPALEYPNVTLLTGAMAVLVETNLAGTAATHVEVERDGERERFAGDIIVLAAGAANTAKLLLRSASDRFPNGLANGSGQVGRNYMCHRSQAVMALSKEPNDSVFPQTLGINDFYFGNDDFEYPMGNIQLLGASGAEMFRGDGSGAASLAPAWTLDDIARHAVDFWLSTEDLPRARNRITIDADANIHLAYQPGDPIASRHLYQQLKSMLGKLDMHPEHLIPRYAYMKSDMPIAAVAHQAGTCRFGTDPSTSVLNPQCRAHELDNLYVVDASVFPSIGAVNPALTVMANAMRVGQYLMDRLG